MTVQAHGVFRQLNGLALSLPQSKPSPDATFPPSLLLPGRGMGDICVLRCFSDFLFWNLYLQKVRNMALDDVVILNVDTNTLETPFDDLQSLPNDVVGHEPSGF